MFGLSATLKYYLCNGSVDMRKGVFGLSEVVRSEMSDNPNDENNVYMFISKSRKVVKLLHYERGFYVLYEKRPLMGKFKKPIYDDESKSYQISWSDMVYLTESVVITSIRLQKQVV
jgi:transposase